MKELKKLIIQYGERYSIAVIYTAFAFVSLLVSVILFGILHSTGIMKLVFSGAVQQAEFGGAFAGFLATLIFLIGSYNRASKDTKLIITGNVLRADGNPIQGALVFVEGVDRQKETDAIGWFTIEVNERPSWMVRASYEDRTAQATVMRADVLKPVRLTLTSGGLLERADEKRAIRFNDVSAETQHQEAQEAAIMILQDLLGKHRTLVEDGDLLLFKGIAAGWSHLTSRLEGEPHSEPPRIYQVDQLLDLWRDVYGAEWHRDKPRPRTITPGTRLELQHVILHEYPSISPGFRYTVDRHSILQMRESELRKEGIDKANEFLRVFEKNPRGVYESYRLHNYDYDDYLEISYRLINHRQVGQEALKPFLYRGVHYFCRILDVRYLPFGDETRRYYLGATGGDREGSPASFPLIVGPGVYSQIQEKLEHCGAARVKSIRGTVKVDRYLMPSSRLTSPFFQTYRREPLVLEVDEAQSIQLENMDIENRGPLLGDAWTIALINGGYEVFAATFELGKEEWRSNLSNTCNWLKLYTETRGGVVISDFDAKNRPFPNAPIHPEIVLEWLRELQFRNLALP